MQASETTAPAERCDPWGHDWRPAGECTHGFTGQIEFEAYTCAECGLGGHRRKGAFACARRREKAAERADRIALQAVACPVWDRLSDDAKTNLRAL